MSLNPSDVWRSLDQKQAEFKAFNQDILQVWQLYRRTLAQLSRRSETDLAQALAHQINPGARPLEPWGHCSNWVMPSQLRWSSREESLEWVRDRLIGITTFAVDGSQIFPSQDVSIPIALVQVGWFENPHLPWGQYDKNTQLQVLSPANLQSAVYNRPLERHVNMYRFQMEIQRLIGFMERHAHRADCLVFFDGSLVGTFAEGFDPDCRAFYAQCFLALLRTSEQLRVPLVGYIDTSRSRDLVQMMQHLQALPDAPNLFDAQLLASTMGWGDRTPLFLCDRQGQSTTHGILKDYQEQADQIAFTYLKANHNPPARLEFPRWIYDVGLLETLLNYVRGEIITGGGYPYAIETADQVAVLKACDRRLFFRVLQNWSDQQDLDLRFSRKMISKVLRRG
jgi:hypothetical protein